MSSSTDISSFVRGLDQGRRRIARATREAAQEHAQKVLAKAVYYCPKGESGNLAASGEIGQIKLSGDAVSIDVGFTAPYAAIVHEDLTAAHDDGQAKFLERAQRELPLAPFVANKIRQALT